MAALRNLLDRCGEAVADLWLGLFGIFVLIAFPATGIVVSFSVGALATELVGRGTLGVITFLLVAYFFGLFLSVYVWQPHVKPMVCRLADVISSGRVR